MSIRDAVLAELKKREVARDEERSLLISRAHELRATLEDFEVVGFDVEFSQGRLGAIEISVAGRDAGSWAVVQDGYAFSRNGLAVERTVKTIDDVRSVTAQTIADAIDEFKRSKPRAA